MNAPEMTKRCGKPVALYVDVENILTERSTAYSCVSNFELALEII
jgi:hypothetical protein